MNYADKLMFFVITYLFLKSEGQTEQELDKQTDVIFNEIFSLFDSVVNQGSPEFFVEIGHELEIKFYNTAPGYYLLKMKMPAKLVRRYFEVLKLYQLYYKMAQKMVSKEQLKFADYFLDFSAVSLTDGVEIQIKKR